MNKKGAKIIIEHVLARSNHRTIQNFENLGCKTLTPVRRMTDQSYLDTNLSKIYCDFLLENQFTILPKKQTNFLSYAKQMRTFLPPREIVQDQPIEIEGRLIQLTKKLEELKHSDEVYIEAEDVIYSMSAEQAFENKDYLMHIYKWVLNQKGRIKDQILQNCQSLKKVVVGKLCDAYARGELNKEIQAELDRMEVLSKAREYSMKGENKNAKLAYEDVFKNSKNNDIIRMEALEYLCKYCQKKGDRNYLKTIMEGLREKKGEQRHRQYVERVLSQLGDRTDIKMATEKPQQ